MLKSGGRVCKSEGHDTPFKGAVAGVESSFPFVALLDTDQVVCVMEVDFRIKSCLSWAVEEVGDVGEGVAVLLHDLIQTAEVDAEVE